MSLSETPLSAPLLAVSGFSAEVLEVALTSFTLKDVCKSLK